MTAVPAGAGPLALFAVEDLDAPVEEPGAVCTVPAWLDTTGGPSPRDLVNGGWRDGAACFTPWDLWFSDSPRDQDLARAACGGCPVTRDCLAYALVRQEGHGIWAGTTPADRLGLAARLRNGETLGAVLDSPAAGGTAAAGRGGAVAA